MKKFLMLWVLALTMLTGMEVQAAEATPQKDANEIVKKSNEVMSTKRVVKVDEYIISFGQRQKLLTVEVDANTKISYVNMMGIEIYTDDNTQLMYMYEPSEGKWYVENMGNSEVDETLTPVTDTIDPVTNYTYKETTLYQNISCDVIEVNVKDNSTGAIYQAVYYINESTYEVVLLRLTDSYNITVEAEYSFPESVTLPQTVTQSAVLFPGSSVNVKGIEYTASVGKQRTVKVTSGKKASGKVSIPDKITFAGKDYKVPGIADNAFAKNKNVKNVTLGKNIKTIGQKAFFKCKSLNQVTIQSTVLKKVGSKAFYGNAKTLKVKTPKGKQEKYRKLIEKSKTSSKLKM